MTSPPDLVLLGNLLVDDIVFADGRTLMGEAGGAMLYVSLAARLWGARVGLVSVAGTDYPRATLDALAARGIDLAGVRALRRPGVRTWLLNEPGGRRVIHHLGSPAHVDVSPEPGDIPRSYAGARAFHLSPMPLPRQCQLASEVGGAGDSVSSTRGSPANPAAANPAARDPTPSAPSRAFVSLDPHETIHDGNLGDWCAALDHADLFGPGEDEFRLAEAADHPAAASEKVRGARLRFLILKRGARGGLLIDRQARDVWEWRAWAPRVVDTTGAGDAFLGGFLAGWLDHSDLERSIAQGIASASLAIEDWGSRALMDASPESAERRRRELGDAVQRTTSRAFMLGWNRQP